MCTKNKTQLNLQHFYLQEKKDERILGNKYTIKKVMRAGIK
jgi:hypothetical protein